jgi:hypothetical protein
VTLKPLLLSLSVGLALVAGRAAGDARLAAVPGVAFDVQHEPCCGNITPEGRRLVAVIDSMHVEQKWQAKEHINWETGEPDRPANYEGPGKATHCSAFVAALGERLNVYLLRPPQHGQILLASAQAEWFHDKDGVEKGWKPLDGPDHERTAQEMANQGFLVMIVYESPNPHTPGHIVVVRPSEKSMEQFRKEGPQIAQAGTINYSSYVAAQAFIHHPGAWPEGVHYYWHKVDWASIPNQPAN